MKEFALGLVIALVLGAALAGRIWVRLPLCWGRAAAWSALAGGVAAAATLSWGPLARMVAICCVLLAAMKALVYVEWAHRRSPAARRDRDKEGSAGQAARGRRLAWKPYLAFAFLWFGMDPGPFAARRSNLGWRSQFVTGTLCVIAGTLAALIVRGAGWTSLLLLFVPLSVGFHYGALGLLTAGWRGWGHPVRALFRNPLRSRGLADFWAARWNLGYAHMMARVVMRPSERVIGSRGAIFAVFVVSGLLHEVAITLPVGAGYGLPTLYFVLQGLAVEGERLIPEASPKKLWAVLWVVGPLGLLFPPAFRDEVILPALHILPDLSGLLF